MTMWMLPVHDSAFASRCLSPAARARATASSRRSSTPSYSFRRWRTTTHSMIASTTSPAGASAIRSSRARMRSRCSELLAQRVELARIVRRAPRVLERALRVVGLGEVMGEHRRELVAAIGEQGLERHAGARVQLAAARAQQQPVRRFAGHRVLEDVLALGVARALAHDLLHRQGADVRLDVLDALGGRRGVADRLEHPVHEDPADHRRGLRDALGRLGQAVDARAEHAGQGLRDVGVDDGARGAPASVLAHHLPAIDERAQHLLEVEGVAVRALDDPRPDALGQVLDRQQVAEQRARIGGGRAARGRCARMRCRGSPGGDRRAASWRRCDPAAARTAPAAARRWRASPPGRSAPASRCPTSEDRP